MKRLYIALLMIVLSAVSISAQWQKIGDYNIGATGQITVYGSYVYYYGNQAGYKLYRYDENGENFTDLTTNAAATFSHIYGFDGKLYACYLSTFYTSVDNGQTWSVLSTVSVTGNGAILRIINDGETLYGVSNRKSIFKSTDKGSSWQEIIINDPRNLIILNLAVVGDTYFAIIQSSGAWVSKDAGQTWVINNVSSSITLSNVYNYNGKIFGQPFYNGLYTYDFGTDTWSITSSGLPSDGAFYNVKSISHVGGTLYLAGSALIGSASTVFTSSNAGSSWDAINQDGLASLNGAGSMDFITANSKNIFYYYHDALFDPTQIGFYKLPYTAITGLNKLEEIPAEFKLSQNYPNPFNPSTKINFSIPQSNFVSLKIFNSIGEEVKELINQSLSPGSYSVDFNASNLTSGVYFYRLNTDGFVQIKKMLLVK